MGRWVEEKPNVSLPPADKNFLTSLVQIGRIPTKAALSEDSEMRSNKLQALAGLSKVGGKELVGSRRTVPLRDIMEREPNSEIQ
jgi:hypothetical protein